MRSRHLDRTAGRLPCREASPNMRHIWKAHVLRGLRCERRAPSAGAVEDEALGLAEHRLGIGAFRVDPELEHAPGTREGARDPALALDLARIAEVDKDHAAVPMEAQR